ncbi:MAG: PD-(D/E)XK nuclease family protein [Candidatus Heimdallarchaeota archaeon]|nr:PD-(D/E)XK nuclease family protein [Candidatus Heimdallarchaeota archaeon]
MLEKGFNLSKTEFVAYLICPFQFYIMKDLNKQTNQSMRYDYSDYEPTLLDGIKKHQWLQEFHQTYGADIQNNAYPRLQESDNKKNWKKKFIDYEIKRFKEKPEFWEPVAVEFFLKSQNYRGKIDRIDQINTHGHCRIVENKPYPSEFDEEELLFYTALLTSLIPCPDLPAITKVAEIGVYYYYTGEFYKSKVTIETMRSFNDYLEKIRKKMLNPRSIKKKRVCDLDFIQCLYREICQRINIKHQKLIGLSNI